MNTSATPAPMALVRDPGAVDQLIARVLCRAHGTMEAVGAPSEARAILHVAHSFADELATLDPRFRPPAVHKGRHGGSVVTSAIEIHTHQLELQVERALASIEGAQRGLRLHG